MKKLIAITLLISVFFLGQAVLASHEPLDLTVKTLYSAPLEDSNVIYNFPIEVKLLDISPDGNWYKVKVSFYIGPFGYTYVGWANIPITNILAERDKEIHDLASLLEDNQ